MQIPMRLHTQQGACGQGDALAGDAWTWGWCVHRGTSPLWLNPSQIPVALLEPQLLWDACEDFEQS